MVSSELVLSLRPCFAAKRKGRVWGSVFFVELGVERSRSLKIWS